MAAATRKRLNRLPGVTPSTWLEFLYYERTFALAVLVGLSLYATLCSPGLKAIDPTDGSSPPDSQEIAAG
ncbi:MAG: hypothetical protein IAG10_20680 [Planctomycetaceae bacterium]|nr:hypothetical protein [Planctomycetaceae bacterium]